VTHGARTLWWSSPLASHWGFGLIECRVEGTQCSLGDLHHGGNRLRGDRLGVRDQAATPATCSASRSPRPRTRPRAVSALGWRTSLLSASTHAPWPRCLSLATSSRRSARSRVGAFGWCTRCSCRRITVASRRRGRANGRTSMGAGGTSRRAGSTRRRWRAAARPTVPSIKGRRSTPCLKSGEWASELVSGSPTQCVCRLLRYESGQLGYT
jgi:hypothetical protein